MGGAPGDRVGPPDADPPPAPRDDRRPGADRLLWGALVAVLVVVAALGIAAQVRGRKPPLEVLGTLPEFSLVERSGRPAGSADLRGRVWVADFVFTRCSGICPLLSSGLAGLQGRTGADVRLVSFSVDPLHDTPEVLRAYARGYGADPERWLFLTGDRDAIHRLVRDGFRLAVAEAPPGSAEPGELVTHSDRLVLVDRGLRVRGYYRGTDREDVERLLGDLERLDAEGRS